MLHDEVRAFVDRHKLSGRGVGWVDAHLLASATVAGRGPSHRSRLAGAAGAAVGASVPKRLRYFFLQRDAKLQGAALRLFLRAVESCLRPHSPGSGPAARLGAVAFIHRFGSSLNAHLHFHCVVIDGAFDSAPTGRVVFHAAAGLDATATADVQAGVRRRLLRVFAPWPAAER